MIHGIPREANSLRPVPNAARPSRTARRMLFSFMGRSKFVPNDEHFNIGSGFADRTQSFRPRHHRRDTGLALRPAWRPCSGTSAPLSPLWRAADKMNLGGGHATLPKVKGP